MTERAYVVVQICYAAHDKERHWKNFSIQDETNKVRTYRNGKLLEVPHFAVGVVFGLVPAGKDRPTRYCYPCSGSKLPVAGWNPQGKSERVRSEGPPPQPMFFSVILEPNAISRKRCSERN